MRIIAQDIAFRNGAKGPPNSDDLIEHLEWICAVTPLHSRQSIFAYGLMSIWSKQRYLSEKQQDAALDMAVKVRDAYQKDAKQ